jgi:soluble P-type ATPase
MDIEIPGLGSIVIRNLVTDYTGTLSVSGRLIEGVSDRIKQVSDSMEIHVLTADTFGTAASELNELPVKVIKLKEGGEDIQKEVFVNKLGPETVVALGNGNNDRLMLRAARIGIAIMEGEGCASSAVRDADIIVRSIIDALDMLLEPLRIKATLRA